jgi:hypothetical protein
VHFSARHAGTDLLANWQSIAIVLLSKVRSLLLGSLGFGWPRRIIPAIFVSLARLDKACLKAGYLGTNLA